MKNNIAKILKARGISQKVFADRLGVHSTNLNMWVKNRSDPKDGEMWQRMADDLEVPLADLFVIDEDDDAEEKPTHPGLPFAGTTQAGAFIEVDLFTNHRQQYVALSPDPRYQRAKQYVWQVRGDSMNKANILDGMWAIGVDYVDFSELYRPAASGDIVVVERTRFGGQEKELTIKRYWEEKGGVALIPESTNEAYKTIFIPRDGDVEGEEVRILAYVTGAYTLFGKALFDLDEGQMIEL
jgi:SOS-response transcriptional repressor LexA